MRIKISMLAVLAMAPIVMQCTAQDKNEKTAGTKGLDLDGVVFNKPAEPTMSASNGYYKRTEYSQTNETIGYRYFLSKKNNPNQSVRFGDTDLGPVRVEYLTAKDGKTQAVLCSFESPKKIDLAGAISKKYQSYAVKLKNSPAAYENFQWDTPEKYIALSVSGQMEGKYMHYLLIADRKAVSSGFPVNTIAQMPAICLDQSCKN